MQSGKHWCKHELLEFECGLHAAQEDSSLTRSDAYFLDLFKQAGYTVLGSALQRNFPKGLFKVPAPHICRYQCIVRKYVQQRQSVLGAALHPMHQV
jgi:hypothetical protein